MRSDDRKPYAITKLPSGGVEIRNTVKYVPYKYKERFCRDLKSVYTAPTEEAGLLALDAVKAAWADYAI